MNGICHISNDEQLYHPHNIIDAHVNALHLNEMVKQVKSMMLPFVASIWEALQKWKLWSAPTRALGFAAIIEAVSNSTALSSCTYALHICAHMSRRLISVCRD